MLLLCGKTCSGKNITENELIKLGMESVVTYTTRPQRKGEIDGITYHFIKKDDFLEKKKQGFFAETTSYNVATRDTWYYGSAIEDLSNDKVIIVNPEGLKKFKKVSEINPVAFYLIADEKTIQDRLRKRGDNVAEAQRRLSSDNEDFKEINRYIDFAIKNDSTFTPTELANIIIYLYKTTLNKKERRINV